MQADRSQSDNRPDGHESGLKGLARKMIALSAWLAGASNMLAIACLTALLVLVIAGILAGMVAKYFPAAAGAMSVSWEYEGYLMGAAFMLAMPRALRHGVHIRVSLITDNVGPGVGRILELCSCAFAFAVVFVLAKALVGMTIDAFSGNNLSTASLTPLWIPEGIFALSAVLLAVQLLARMVAVLADLPVEEVKEYIGAPVE